uniref:Transmembrane p24 trafficking protein 5 n=1 Tax=Mus spicilegus TaxID=10103 RepID=A0A8C6HPX2_MUSSI
MSGRMWLPFPVLLLSALPAALLRGAAGFTPSLDSDFTFTLPAGRKECFYQPMPLKASLEIEYQVLDGGELDIDFHLTSPEGRTLVFEQRKSDGVHTVYWLAWNSDLPASTSGVLELKTYVTTPSKT